MHIDVLHIIVRTGNTLLDCAYTLWHTTQRWRPRFRLFIATLRWRACQTRPSMDERGADMRWVESHNQRWAWDAYLIEGRSLMHLINLFTAHCYEDSEILRNTFESLLLLTGNEVNREALHWIENLLKDWGIYWLLISIQILRDLNTHYMWRYWHKGAR